MGNRKTEKIDLSMKLDQLLRRAVIFATDYSDEDMDRFARLELLGYEKEDSLPDYRKRFSCFLGYIWLGVEPCGLGQVVYNTSYRKYQDIDGKRDFLFSIDCCLNIGPYLVESVDAEMNRTVRESVGHPGLVKDVGFCYAKSRIIKLLNNVTLCAYDHFFRVAKENQIQLSFIGSPSPFTFIQQINSNQGNVINQERND